MKKKPIVDSFLEKLGLALPGMTPNAKINLAKECRIAAISAWDKCLLDAHEKYKRGYSLICESLTADENAQLVDEIAKEKEMILRKKWGFSYE